MSYNITSWRTKKCNLIIPIEAFYEGSCPNRYPEPALEELRDGFVTLECGCEQEIEGHLSEGDLTVTDFHMAGEGSGTFMRDVLNHALEQSSGVLDAVLLWEGGDTIERLTVKDGAVIRKEIQL